MKRSIRERWRKNQERAAKTLIIVEREKKSKYAIRTESKPQLPHNPPTDAPRWHKNGTKI